MRYDASWEGLFYPERRAPLAVAAHNWTPDALCAEFSRLVFIRFERDPEPLRQALAAHGFDRAAFFHDPHVDTWAFAAIDREGTAIVSFRGTCKDSLRNIVTDLKAWPVPWAGGGWVHAGFNRAYCNSVRGEIEAWLAAQQHQRLICTGISLGAALATLLAAERRDAALVTFGSPRVGTRRFCAHFEGREVRRYTECADAVPDLPPPLGYRHVSPMIYIDRLGSLHPQPPSLTKRIADRLRSRASFIRRHLFRRGRTLSRSLSDHAPINYVSALLGIREN